MSFSKSRGFSLLKYCSLGIFVCLLLAAPLSAQQEEAPAALQMQVTLIGINAYQEVREIRAALAQMEGTEKVSLDSEAPGLITLHLSTTGSSSHLIEKLSGFFPNRYEIQEKLLPGGGTETIIQKTVTH